MTITSVVSHTNDVTTMILVKDVNWLLISDCWNAHPTWPELDALLHFRLPLFISAVWPAAFQPWPRVPPWGQVSVLHLGRRYKYAIMSFISILFLIKLVCLPNSVKRFIEKHIFTVHIKEIQTRVWQQRASLSPETNVSFKTLLIFHLCKTWRNKIKFCGPFDEWGNKTSMMTDKRHCSQLQIQRNADRL